MSTFRSFTQYFRTYPLRGILTVLTIAIGTGVLIVTFSLSFDVGRSLEDSLSNGGIRITIANATTTDDGTIDWQFPPAFTSSITDLLETDYENLLDATIVRETNWDRISAGDTSYQVRSVISAEPTYADLMNLDMAAGSFFTREDIDNRREVVVISEETAIILFGSPEAAVGQQISTAVPVASPGGGGFRMRMVQQPFDVVGVYSTISELERESFGVGDFIIPLGIDMPAGIPVDMLPGSVVMARVVNTSLEAATSRIGSIIEVEYGEDASLAVWEGSPSGPAPMIAESRESVQSFALTVNVLGVIVLIASSIGIFSIMLVEVLNRLREIGLRRALGATRADIRRFFLMQALYFSGLGSIVGTALAFAFYRVIGGSLLPFFERSGLAAAQLDFVAPGALPIALAVGSALIVGVAFGFFPALSASRTPIVETIREEAA